MRAFHPKRGCCCNTGVGESVGRSGGMAGVRANNLVVGAEDYELEGGIEYVKPIDMATSAHWRPDCCAVDVMDVK